MSFLFIGIDLCPDIAFPPIQTEKIRSFRPSMMAEMKKLKGEIEERKRDREIKAKKKIREDYIR